MKKNPLASVVKKWFDKRGWKIFPFQQTVWREALAGRSGLLHANTGAGKTYAVWFAALQRNHRFIKEKNTGLLILWVTPMRALAADTLRSLEETTDIFRPFWNVGTRTGDTRSTERIRQSKILPSILITTPESLSLLLSYSNACAQFSKLDMVVVDEWHELLGSKRGVQVQLALAHLKKWRPQLVIWGLSATIGHLSQACEVLLGNDSGVLIESNQLKGIEVDTLIPLHPSRFPWRGHLGLQMLGAVSAEIEKYNTTLIFTNTRSQCELWYQNLLDLRPDWAGTIALHHSSLDRKIRQWVELSLKEGKLRAVVCTSSLDLGVDFLPVERVLQIGSAKGIGRLLQRGGRSGHAPGRISRITLVPTHSLELLEAAAAKEAVVKRRIETRLPPEKPFDVLIQHLVTVALGGGFTSQSLLAEIRTAYSYRALTEEEWQWALDFVIRGGQSLKVYPEYQRVEADEENIYRVPNKGIAWRHRLNIGTIVSAGSIRLKYMKGPFIGNIEESFISRLKPGDNFLFSGKILELVRVQDMTAYVCTAKGKKGATPRWQGAKMSFSSELADAVLDQLLLAAQGVYKSEEMRVIKPLLDIQRRWSDLPTKETLVVESMKSREGYHLFVYPFAGRKVHLGLASLFAYRASRDNPNTFSIVANDYGFELLAAEKINWFCSPRENGVSLCTLLDPCSLAEDVLASINATQLSQRHFREIARISGLITEGQIGQKKSLRQLQASATLFFEVFCKHDPTNLLLQQTKREVMEQELGFSALPTILRKLQERRFSFHILERPTPLSFNLMVERFREKLSTEKLSERVARMVKKLEEAVTYDGTEN